MTALDVLTHPGMWPVWVAFSALALYGAWEHLTNNKPPDKETHMPRNLTALRHALRDAAAIKARLHVAQHVKDWPPGDIIGRTAGGWLVYDDGVTRHVLFADWLKT